MSETATIFQKDSKFREGELNTLVADLAEAERQAMEVDEAETGRAKTRIKLDLAASALYLQRKENKPGAAYSYLEKKLSEAYRTTSDPSGKGNNTVEFNKLNAASELIAEHEKGNRAAPDVLYSSEAPVEETERKPYTREDAVRAAAEDFKDAVRDVETAYKQLETPGYTNHKPLPELDDEFGLDPGTLRLVK